MLIKVVAALIEKDNKGLIAKRSTGDENVYVTGISSGLKNALNITTNDYSDVETETVYTTNTANVTQTISNETTFGELNGGVTVRETSTIYVNGSQYTTTVTEDTKVGEYLAWLKNKGFDTATINADGTVTITGKEGVYYTDHNDTLDSLLGLSEKEGVGSAYTTVVTSSVRDTSSTDTVSMTEATTGKLVKDESVSFINESHIIRTIQRIVQPLGRTIDTSNPMVDARLEDGSRINAIIPPLSLS